MYKRPQEFPSWLNLCNSCVMQHCTEGSCWHSGEQITFHTEGLWDGTVSAGKTQKCWGNAVQMVMCTSIICCTTLCSLLNVLDIVLL